MIVQDKFTTNKLCKNCTHSRCCTNFVSPFVFPKDLEKLKELNMIDDSYFDEGTVKGRKVKKIKKKSDSFTCVFWDEKKKGCAIYEYRPFDCRLFPFDIYYIDGEYYWIVYSCNPDSDWTWSEGYLDMFENDPRFADFVDNLDLFSDPSWKNNLEESAEIPFTKLRKVKIRSKKYIKSDQYQFRVKNETRNSFK